MPTAKTNRAINVGFALQIVFLAAIIVVCYLPAIDSFFVVDDFWQVSFAHKVFDGRAELIWRNFTSNYLQLPGFDFYRPLVGCSFLFDYLFWKANAIGYHITNVFLYALGTFIFYVFVREMTRGWGSARSSCTAFFSALQFAVNPLHCEAVAWISGRADILCAPFYLISLYLIAKSHRLKKPSLYWIALAGFWMALLCKEIAIGLPAVIFVFYFIWPEDGELSALAQKQEKADEPPGSKPKTRAKKVARVPSKSEDAAGRELTNFNKRCRLAIKQSAPFLISAAIYLFIRFVALGNFIGGYSGIMAIRDNPDLFVRWLDPAHYLPILLPFPVSLTTNNAYLNWLTLLCFLICLLLALSHALAKRNPSGWLVFLVLWMFTTIVPIAKLWSVGPNLEDSRLLFFFSMGWSALWPVLIFYPAGSRAMALAVPPRVGPCIGAAVLVVISAMYSWSTFYMNCIYLEQGRESRKLWIETVNIGSRLKDDEKIVVLDIPEPIHMNGSTFHHMLRPPFVPASISDRVITFLPHIIVGPHHSLTDSNRLRRLASTPNVKGFYRWQSDQKQFKLITFKGRSGLPDSIELPFQTKSNAIVGPTAWSYHGRGTTEFTGNGIIIHNNDDGAVVEIKNLDISPLEADILEFDLKTKLQPNDARTVVLLAAGWNASGWHWLPPAQVDKLRGFKTFHWQTSRYFQWYSAEVIKSMAIRLFAAETIEIKNARLLKRSTLIPSVEMTDSPLSSGEYVVGDKPVCILFDGSTIAGARSVGIEVSKPNLFFDNYLPGKGESAVNHRIMVSSCKGSTILQPSLFPRPAYYEIRLCCLDANGKPVGTWSDYITVLKRGDGLEDYVF